MLLPLAALLFAQTVSMEGLILEVLPAAQTITVSHKEVPGVMPAMAMPVRVRDVSAFRPLRAGMQVSFDLVTSGSRSEARRVRIIKPENFIDQDGQRVAIPEPNEKLSLGHPLPDLAFTDHHARSLHLEELRGRVLAIQFLYTRCPMPEVCPRLAATFAAIQRRLGSRIDRDVVLLSVTLDPQHDDPAELSRYAEIWRAKEGWRFLTGTIEQIRYAAACFGLVYWPEEGVITHTSTIGIVGRDGKLSALVQGLSFTARQLGDLIEFEADKERKR